MILFGDTLQKLFALNIRRCGRLESNPGSLPIALEHDDPDSTIQHNRLTATSIENQHD